ncbi:MAG TPA: hypothetical protein VLA36_15520 [Longimicrobiales bacterium]|nr:hypothetical protein [Longimicrobiales bacterium]
MQGRRNPGVHPPRGKTWPGLTSIVVPATFTASADTLSFGGRSRQPEVRIPRLESMQEGLFLKLSYLFRR